MSNHNENINKYSELKKRLQKKVSILHSAYKRGIIKLEDLSDGLAKMIIELDEENIDNPEPISENITITRFHDFIN